jgi:hypothetical protein
MTDDPPPMPPLYSGQGSVPVPDPTALTSAAVNAAMTQMRHELETLREIIEARILALENDAALRLEALQEVRPQTERQIRHLQELHGEKFAGLEQRFHDRDARAHDVATAGKEALAAAFESAKELSNLVAEQFKSEISSLRQAADERAKSQDIQFQTLKERIDRGEGQGAGVTAQRNESRLDMGQLVAIVGVIAAVVAVAATIIIATRH